MKKFITSGSGRWCLAIVFAEPFMFSGSLHLEIFIASYRIVTQGNTRFKMVLSTNIDYATRQTYKDESVCNTACDTRQSFWAIGRISKSLDTFNLPFKTMQCYHLYS